MRVTAVGKLADISYICSRPEPAFFVCMTRARMRQCWGGLVRLRLKRKASDPLNLMQLTLPKGSHDIFIAEMLRLVFRAGRFFYVRCMKDSSAPPAGRFRRCRTLRPVGCRTKGGTMNIRVNGKEEEIPSGLTVSELLKGKGLNAAAVVVECNRAIIPPDAFAATVLHEGDELEILHFVGGG